MINCHVQCRNQWKNIFIIRLIYIYTLYMSILNIYTEKITGKNVTGSWLVLIFVLLFSECFWKIISIFFPIIRKTLITMLKTEGKQNKYSFWTFYKTLSIISYFYTLLIELIYIFLMSCFRENNLVKKTGHRRGQ